MLTAKEQHTLNGFFSVFFLFKASQLQAFVFIIGLVSIYRRVL